MADYGFKMSVPGKSINSVDPRDYILWSKYSPLKIIKYGQGAISILAGGGTASMDINHGLGYPPAYLFYSENDNNGRFWLNNTKLGAGNSTHTDGGQARVFSVDRQILSLRGQAPDTNARTVPFRYMLFDQSTFDAPDGADKPIGYNTRDIGFKVAKQGKDVRSAKLYEQILNSNCDYLKYHTTLSGQLPFNNTLAGESYVEFIHGLGYVPAFVLYAYFNTNVQERLSPIFTSPQAFADGAFADTTKIGIDIIWAGSASPANITYNYRLVIFKNNLLTQL